MSLGNCEIKDSDLVNSKSEESQKDIHQEKPNDKGKEAAIDDSNTKEHDKVTKDVPIEIKPVKHNKIEDRMSETKEKGQKEEVLESSDKNNDEDKPILESHINQKVEEVNHDAEIDNKNEETLNEEEDEGFYQQEETISPDKSNKDLNESHNQQKDDKPHHKVNQEVKDNEIKPYDNEEVKEDKKKDVVQVNQEKEHIIKPTKENENDKINKVESPKSEEKQDLIRETDVEPAKNESSHSIKSNKSKNNIIDKNNRKDNEELHKNEENNELSPPKREENQSTKVDAKKETPNRDLKADLNDGEIEDTPQPETKWEPEPIVPRTITQPPLDKEMIVVNAKNTDSISYNLQKLKQKLRSLPRPNSNYENQSYVKSKLLRPIAPKRRILRSHRRSDSNVTEVNSSKNNDANDITDVNMKIEEVNEPKDTPNLKSKLPPKAKNSKKVNEQGGSIQDRLQTNREKLLNDRRQRTRAAAVNKHKAQKQDQNQSQAKNNAEKQLEKQILNKQIIEEELALLKAKNKLTSHSKRPLKSRENLPKLPSQKPKISQEAKEQLERELEKVQEKSKKNYYEKRESRLLKEEQKKKEATEFIRKLKQSKPRQQTKRIDEEYIGKIEQMMEERKQKEVRLLP